MHTLVIYGHPDPESFNQALADAYAEGAVAGGAQVRRLQLHQLDFNPNLGFGYRKRTELEPDLLRAQEDLRWADHLVWVYPVWWGSVPALLKGFLDRALATFVGWKLEGDTVRGITVVNEQLASQLNSIWQRPVRSKCRRTLRLT